MDKLTREWQSAVLELLLLLTVREVTESAHGSRRVNRHLVAIENRMDKLIDALRSAGVKGH